MAIISQEDIDNIRTNANIVDIISSYIPLQKKGKDYKCICPFHDDNHPSMSVSYDKQIYKCFSCNAAGNVFTFVKNYEQVSFVEAVSIVANKIGYNLKGTIEVPTVSKHSEDYKVMELANKYYQNNLNTNKGIQAKKYLLDRGITDEIINDFQIGLALDDKDTLTSLLLKKGIKEEKLVELGLANASGNNLFDNFSGRITFPLHDKDGNIIGFSCRIYRGEDLSKYVNTKETPIYIKGNNLFNYHRAKDSAKKEKALIIVEGQMDAIRVYANGIKNVIALMGTALTKEQIKLIKNLRCKVILCLDGDRAGEDATLTNGDLLIKDNITVQVIRLSDYKDPDEYILNKGIDAFKDNVLKPIDFIDFKMNALKNNYNLDNSEQLATYINQIINDIAKEKDPILKEISLNKISEDYNISIDILKDKLINITKENEIAKETFSISKKKEHKKLDSLNIAIRKVLFYMMNDIKYIKGYQNKLGYFEDRNYRNLANEIVYYSNKNKQINVADFISYITNNEELYDLVLEIIDTHEEDLSMEEFFKYIKVIDVKSNELQIQKLKEELKNELDVNKKVTIIKRITEIKKGSVLDERD